MNSIILIISAAEVPSPGLLALAGMGTVFVSLTLIYLVMAAMSNYLQRTSKAAGTPPASQNMPQKEAKELVRETDIEKNRKTALAIAVAVAKHRQSRVKALSYKAEGGMNPWKLSGRMRGLRK